MSDWRIHLGAAFTDMNAAMTDDEAAALEHLRDAQSNLQKAIEELEGDD